MSIHDETAAAIRANVPGYAQMNRGGNRISWHEHTFTQTMNFDWDATDALCAFIDAWANGEARVTDGTFSDEQIRRRAEQWESGNGPLIKRGFRNPAFGAQIRRLAPDEVSCLVA